MELDLKEFRKQYGISQIALARMTGVSLNAYLRWEYGVSSPNEENRERLEAAIKKIKEVSK